MANVPHPEPGAEPFGPSGQHYDIVIIGGGPAGLSAALMLTRSRRRALAVAPHAPRHGRAGHMHGLPSRRGMPPVERL